MWLYQGLYGIRAYTVASGLRVVSSKFHVKPLEAFHSQNTGKNTDLEARDVRPAEGSMWNCH